MRSLLRNSALHAFSLFVAMLILSGVHVTGGVLTYIIAGFVMTLVSTLIKPLKLIGLPLNMLSIGLFAVFVNMIVLYFLTLIVPAVTIKPFVYHGFTIAGFIIPRLKLNSFFAYGAVALVYTVVQGFLEWLIKI